MPGVGGAFEITVDGRLVFSKKAIGRFPTDEEIDGVGAGVPGRLRRHEHYSLNCIWRLVPSRQTGPGTPPPPPIRRQNGIRAENRAKIAGILCDRIPCGIFGSAGLRVWQALTCIVRGSAATGGT